MSRSRDFGSAAGSLAAPSSSNNGYAHIIDSTQPSTWNYSPLNSAGRNILINGGFEFWQRLASPGTVAQYNANNGYPYSADRWTPMQYQSCRASRVANSYSSPGPISPYVMQINSISNTDLANGARLQIQQKVESVNTYPLRGKTVTLSFWIKFSNSTFTSTNNSAGGGQSTYGDFYFGIFAFTSTTDGYTGSTGADSTVATINITNGSLPTTWTKYSITGVVPTNANNITALFSFASLGSTATNDVYNYQIADVQLEQGSVATPFTRAGGNYGIELQLCQRYYWVSGYPNDSVDYTKHCLGYFTNSTTFYAWMQFPVPMRIAPTSVLSSTLATSGSTIGIYDSIGGINFNVSSFSLDRATTRAIGFNAGTTGATAGRPAQLQNYANTSGYIAFNAEL
jgi:hypothetical protein